MEKARGKVIRIRWASIWCYNLRSPMVTIISKSDKRCRNCLWNFEWSTNSKYTIWYAI